ncbi:MAG: hypothetical protein ABFD29_12310 [Anaerolineaceae bacterium]
MELSKNANFRFLIKTAQPLKLIGGILFYFIGGGIIDYLGRPIQWQTFWIGLAAFILLQLSSYFLNEYFTFQAFPHRQSGKTDRKKVDSGEMSLPQEVFLQVSLISLAVWAVLSYLLLRTGAINVTGGIFWGIAFVVMFFYAVPPFRLSQSGFGEIADAFFITSLLPAWAVVLQIGELHSLLAMLTLPLTALYIAISIALSLENYTLFNQDKHQTILTRMGWQQGMTLHNLLILFSYVFVGIALLTGLPWSLCWPMLMTLPLGIYQTYIVWQIGNGAKPPWKLLRVTSIGLISVSAYLIMYSLWTR